MRVWIRNFFLILLAAVVIAMLNACPAKADVPTASWSGSLAATGNSFVLLLAGQSTCGVVLTGTWVGTATFQASTDGGTTWVTATSLGTNGTATINGTYIGNVASYGLTRFRVAFARTSGTLNYTEVCSSALAASSGGGGGNVTVTNFPVATYGIVSASGNTVVEGHAGVIYGIKNLATVSQTVTITCFDNASTNSGNILVSDVLGASQTDNFVYIGVATTAGITCNLSGAANVGIAVYYK